jgi:hypothetical protein
MSGETEVAMSCRAIREKLNDALAAGQAEAMEHGVALHLQGCGDCRDYNSAQTRLYGAIDSGMRRLVENAAPPSLLPNVRERIAATESGPNRAWVRALAPSAAVLLVASSLLLLVPSRVRKVDETTTVSVAPAPQQNNNSVAYQSESLRSQEAPAVVSNSRPAKFRGISPKPKRRATTAIAVVADQQEANVSPDLPNEIGDNPESSLPPLQPAALVAAESKAIEPLKIARLEIPVLAAED